VAKQKPRSMAKARTSSCAQGQSASSEGSWRLLPAPGARPCAGRFPHSRTHPRARLADRGEQGVVDGVDHPEHRGDRGHGVEDIWLQTQDKQIRQGIPPPAMVTAGSEITLPGPRRRCRLHIGTSASDRTSVSPERSAISASRRLPARVARPLPSAVTSMPVATW
jgi:hypothetical protein